MPIEPEERPVFIIGYERSGTTLLMAMLGCHSRIGIPEVGWLFPRIYPWRHTYGDLSVKANFRVLVEEMLFGLNKPFWGLKLNPATAVDEIADMATQRSFEGVYETMHRRFLMENGNKPRWGQKTPNNLYFVPQIRQCFPNAQFIFIVRDGRDASVTSLSSAFGAGNIVGAASTWHKANAFVRPFRETLGPDVWHDVKYEELCRNPVEVLQGVCAFLGESYESGMLDFYKSPIGLARGKQRDHAPLGTPVSEKEIGIYKRHLSVYEQEIFATLAGATHTAYGYGLDHGPIDIAPAELAILSEWDGRFRAARLDGPGGHIVFESYRDWLAAQREERRLRGIWKAEDDPREFPVGDPDEETIVGYRSPRRFREHFSIKHRFIT